MKINRIVSKKQKIALIFAVIIGISLGMAKVTKADTAVPIYRLYNVSTHEHLYTKDVNEQKVLSINGWQYEGIGWYAPNSGVSVYRLYNSTLKNHLYTTDTNEKNILIRSGWSIDNGGNPVFYSGGSVPIYRTYNAGLSGVHLLTTDSNEYNTLGVQGWSKEGVKLYAVSIGKLIAPSFDSTALVQGFTTALGAPWLGSINVDATAIINKISTNFTIYNGSYKNYSQCVALIEYYLS